MSSPHDGRDGNQRSNLRGGSGWGAVGGVGGALFELIAPMSKHTECAQPLGKWLRRTSLPNNHLELETESCFWNMYFTLVCILLAFRRKPAGVSKRASEKGRKGDLSHFARAVGAGAGSAGVRI